jgi:cytochrome P450
MELRPIPLDAINLSDIQFWTGPREIRESAFDTLRRESPVHFFAEADLEHFPAGPGYWALTKHADIWHASRNRERAVSIVDKVLDQHTDDEFDFVDAIAAPFPLEIICQMMGIPPSDERQILEWSNVILGAGDPDFGGTFENLMNVSLEIFAYAQAHGEARLKQPSDDLTSVMMHATVDGDRMTPQEFGSFFILLVVAGNETTRNAISHGMLALTEHPDQRRTWFDNFDTHTKTAVEEIVRWATPVINFRRTATRDTEIRGVKIAEGDKVVLWYNSGNRDEEVYVDPYRFDVARPINPAQIGFGAGGPHFCLGANLARREIAVMFDEIRRRLPDLQITGEPAYLQSNFINGIKRMPCRIHP